MVVMDKKFDLVCTLEETINYSRYLFLIEKNTKNNGNFYVNPIFDKIDFFLCNSKITDYLKIGT